MSKASDVFPEQSRYKFERKFCRWAFPEICSLEFAGPVAFKLENLINSNKKKLPKLNPSTPNPNL